MKKLIIFFILIICFFVFSACSKEKKDSENYSTDEQSSALQNAETEKSTQNNKPEETNQGVTDKTELLSDENNNGNTTVAVQASEYINGVDITKGSKVTMVNLNKAYIHFHNDPSCIEYVEQTANKIVNSEMTQFQAVRAISDFIVDNYSYGTENNFNEFISKKTGWCADYASLFQYLCKQVGIDARVLIGTVDKGSVTGNHAWNSVVIDGTEYFVDVTFADTCNDKKSYLFLSESKMNYGRTVVSTIK